MRKEKIVYNNQHLNPVRIFDRGSPIFKIFLFSFILLIFGLIFSLKIFIIAGAIILFFIFVPFFIWLYLKLK